jgi:hypothetical protein
LRTRTAEFGYEKEMRFTAAGVVLADARLLCGLRKVRGEPRLVGERLGLDARLETRLPAAGLAEPACGWVCDYNPPLNIFLTKFPTPLFVHQEKNSV